MLRFAKPDDVSALIRLYDDCFPNEHTFALNFFKKVFPREKCVLFDDGKIKGMLNLVDISIEQGEKLNGLYIFAVGVEEKSRSLGIGSKLIGFAEEYAVSKKYDFLCLIAENDGLFDYYARFGFLKNLFCSKLEFRAVETVEVRDKFTVKADTADYLKLSQKFISKPRILRTVETLETQFSVYGISSVFLSDGKDISAAAFFEKSGSRLEVYEVLGEKSDAQYLLNLSANRLRCETIRLRAPLGMYKDTPIGCLKPLSIRAEKLKSSKIYANLLFN